VSASKIWLIMFVFLAGVFITPLALILTTGGDDASLPSLRASPVVPDPNLVLQRQDAAASPPAMTPTPAAAATATTAAAATVSPAPSRPSSSPTTQPPEATPAAQPRQAQGGGSDLPALSGRYRITDTITDGSGSGTVISFDVVLQQSGSTVSGGNAEIQVSGQVEGATLRAQFVQPGLRYTGTFTWVLDTSGGSGNFVSTVPNSGSSHLTRL
jgi:hypothetical protein